jgi:multiple sugar transport system permease protein
MTAVGQSIGGDQTQESSIVLKRPTEAPLRESLGRSFAAPLLAWLAVTVALPLAYCVWISLTNANTMGGSARFVGFANYVALLSNLNLLHPLGLTVAWAIGGAVVQTALAAFAALLLQQRFRGRHIARTWIIASWVIPTIVTAFLWRWMLNADFGVINHFLRAAHLVDRPIDFLGSPSYAFATATWINAWRWFPFMTLLILAALTRIAPEYYEAARVEGATEWQVFRKVTLPFIQPVLYAVGLLGTLWSVNVFDIIWLTTKGGPLAATTTMPVAIYVRAFQQFKLGEACAMSVVLAVVLLAFAVIYLLFASTGASEQEVL